ncbi:FkbM family methyltransferase [Flavobacteriaceae bacterium MAR_2010_72]|nr:FkbM family methyltransferase [Flavobacteriaceae bacterium MAR_2010_72]
MKKRSIQKNSKTFNVSITKRISYWEQMENGTWEPNTFKIFDHFINRDTVVLDVGAWIGQTALYTSQIAKQTIAFEPDPIAFKELETNVSLNKDALWAPQLTIYNKAIGSSNGTIKLGSRGQGGDSMSSTLFSDRETHWNVTTITLDDVIEKHQLQNENLFIKMDIEGGEYNLVPQLKTIFKKYNVVLFLSLHTFFLMNSLKSHSTKESILKKVWRRWRFFWLHVKLAHAMPFNFFYLNSGKKVTLFKVLFKTFIYGKFPSEIVASNQPWHPS